VETNFCARSGPKRKEKKGKFVYRFPPAWEGEKGGAHTVFADLEKKGRGEEKKGRKSQAWPVAVEKEGVFVKVPARRGKKKKKKGKKKPPI